MRPTFARLGAALRGPSRTVGLSLSAATLAATAALAGSLAPAADAADTVTGAPVTSTLTRAGEWIVDGQGRVFITHGTNVINKVAPYYPNTFTDADAAFLAKEGFTTVRLGWIWEAAEPSPGVIDEAYLDRLLAVDTLLARHGIRTMVDNHQDFWSADTPYVGKGAPAWASLGANAEESWAAFWRNDKASDGVGIRDHFTAVWKRVVAKAVNHPNIMGLAPMNEPQSGTDYAECQGGLGAPCPQFEKTALHAANEEWTAAMRAAGWNRLIFPEGVPDNFPQPKELPAPSDPQTAFSYHYYCLPTLLAPQETPVGGFSLEALFCRSTDVKALALTRDYLKAIKRPGILTEFSATDINPETAQIVDLVTPHFTSWMSWAYYSPVLPMSQSDTPGQGILRDSTRGPVAANIKDKKLQALVVPYPQAIAGTPQATSYNRSSRVFTVDYSTAPVPGAMLDAAAVTQVFVPQRVYPKGYRVQVTGGRVVSAPNAPLLLIAANSTATAVKVSVSPTA